MGTLVSVVITLASMSTWMLSKSVSSLYLGRYLSLLCSFTNLFINRDYSSPGDLLPFVSGNLACFSPDTFYLLFLVTSLVLVSRLIPFLFLVTSLVLPPIPFTFVSGNLSCFTPDTFYLFVSGNLLF